MWTLLLLAATVRSFAHICFFSEFFCFCYAMLCFDTLFSALWPLLLLASFIQVHAAPSHLYILQLFIPYSFIVSSCFYPVSVCDVAIVFFYWCTFYCLQNSSLVCIIDFAVLYFQSHLGVLCALQVQQISLEALWTSVFLQQTTLYFVPIACNGMLANCGRIKNRKASSIPGLDKLWLASCMRLFELSEKI